MALLMSTTDFLTVRREMDDPSRKHGGLSRPYHPPGRDTGADPRPVTGNSPWLDIETGKLLISQLARSGRIERSPADRSYRRLTRYPHTYKYCLLPYPSAIAPLPPLTSPDYRSRRQSTDPATCDCGEAVSLQSKREGNNETWRGAVLHGVSHDKWQR